MSCSVIATIFFFINLIVVSLCAFEEPIIPLFPNPTVFNPLFPSDVSNDINENVNPPDQELKEGFYDQSCPNAEQIVADQVAEIVKTNPRAIATFIRLQFHDCFVGGCDASILLDSVSSGDNVEKSSLFNGESLKGVTLIDDIKMKLEQECPGVVSCADTLAFAAAESMVIGGLPNQPRLGGRRDGLSSLASKAEDNLPLPTWTMDQMLQLFNKKGFNEEDLVVLLGAHSIGAAHCNFISDRIYNYDRSGKSDPALSQIVVGELKQMCTAPGTPEAMRNPSVDFDETPEVLDNLFFKNLVEKNKALLATDQLLITDKRTASIVEMMASDPNLFVEKFMGAMIRLTSLDVITGKNGEVRNTCRSTN